MEGVTQEDFQDREIGSEKHWVGVLRENKLEETDWNHLGIPWYSLHIIIIHV